MPARDFLTLDVFTTVRFGGNPLAVLPDAAGLDTAAMQRIAREFNLSETTFVFPPENPAHTARVRIFTPTTELPFAGHPNVGTALALARRAGTRPDRMVFEEAAGPVSVALDWSGPHPVATVTAPVPLTLGALIPPGLVAACAGLSAPDLVPLTHPPRVAGIGASFVIAEVTPEALSRAAPDPAAIARAAAAYPVPPLGFALHLHAATPTGRRARMFAPLAGIPEDPATGAANLALAALLLSVSDAPDLSLLIEQGAEMNRPSLLHTRAWRQGSRIHASVGGSAVPVSQGTIETD